MVFLVYIVYTNKSMETTIDMPFIFLCFTGYHKAIKLKE